MDPPKPIHLVECKTPDQVDQWLKDHVRQWHYGQVMPGCGLCELAQAKRAVLTAPKTEPTF